MEKWLKCFILYFCTTLLSCSYLCPINSYTNLSCEYCKKDYYVSEIICNTSESGEDTFSFRLHENETLEVVCKNSPNWSDISIHGFNIEQNLNFVVFTDCELPTSEQLNQLFKQFKIVHVNQVQILTHRYKENFWNFTKDNLLGFNNITRFSVLGYNMESLPSDLLKDMKRITEVSIAYNKLTNIPEDFFQNSNLQRIDVIDSTLSVIKRNHFKNLKNLENLHLTGNDIIEIEENSFDDLINLTKISIHSNILNELPRNLFCYQNKLETMNLGSNNFSLHSFQSNLLENLRNLKIFRLWDNKVQLETLPHKFFGNLKQLERVYINNNGFKYLPSDLFFNTSGMLKLYLQNNSLTALPENIFNYSKKLRFISLASNKLDFLPRRVFSGLDQLSELDVSNNYVEVIHRNLFNDLSSLKELYMEDNRLKVIDNGALNHLENLVIAKFSRNQLTFTPSSYSLSMNISGNRTPFHNATNLKELDLSHNMIPRIFPDWLQLKTLRNLNISYNNLTKLEVHDFNFNATSLKIDLSHNKIHDILLEDVDSVSWSYKLTKSIKVKLADNPINCSRNVFHLLNYLEGKTKKRNKNSLTLDVESLRCNTPVELKGRLVKQLEREDVTEYNLRNEINPTKYEIDEDKIYDAFISFSHKDDIFVNELIHKLENGTEKYKLCVHYRDWPAGEWIADQVFRSVNDSRRTIVVLSQNFVTSEWGKMEFRTAYHQALSDNVTRVIIVVYGDIADIEILDNDLKFFVDMTTHVMWDDPKFWEKLNKALSHNVRI